ncbi:PAS domain S-box protein [Rufibacter sp. XAAS-G3-1]|uniref:PAS domain S-box protein n=1 Tax=Rufibacter sp. XAAS-G3-1 TaxID=2729134 RepID=UPI0015E74433|nr:PAS domain S-box protein [Rufibacter sp. XAAS-G3-1]
MEDKTQKGSEVLKQEAALKDGAAARPLTANKEETATHINVPEPEGDTASYQEQLQALQRELQQARQELEDVKEQAKNAASVKMNTSLLQEVREFKRVMELERLSKQVLEKNTQPGSTLESTVAFCLKGIEKLYKGMYCSCTRLEGDKLYMIAAPSLPESFRENSNGITIGKKAGSYDAAAFLGGRVIASDIKTDHRWKDYFQLLLPYGLESCWSFPLVGSNQKVLGTLAVYHQEVKTPTTEQEETLEGIRHLLQLILENKRSEEELRFSNERFHYATMATNDAIWDFDILAGRINWGIGFERLFGFNVEEFGPELDVWAAQVHPDDLKRVEASLQEFISKGDQEHWREEYRFRKASGEYAYVVDQGTLLKDDTGRPTRVVGAIQDVTSHKLVEEELRKLSLVARETMNAVIIMRPDGAIQWINSAFTRMLGYTLEEIEGRKPNDFLVGPETDLPTIHYLYQQFNRTPLEVEIAHYTKSREKLWFKLQMQPLFDAEGQVDCVFALLTDITQRKAEEQQLRLLESVISNVQDAIIISKANLEKSGQLEAVFFNKAFTQLTGYEKEEVLGGNLSFIVGPNTNQETVSLFQQSMAEGQVGEAELEIYRKDRSSFWVQLLIMPMLNSQQVLTHWISMFRDITNRKHYELEREVFISELTQNNADLKQFTFITSHNLRAPLANLTGIANLIDTQTIPEGRNKILIQKFKESTAQLNAIINDLLEVLVIKNNPHTNKEEVDLAKAFEKVVLSVDGLLAEKDIQLTTDFSQVPQVYYNAGYLHSILLNLLTNAIKYRSPDRALHIGVKAEKVNGKDTLYFTDNGLGIDLKRFGERIFGLYQRFHHHKDSKGMGLYIAHSQAKAMGGNLSVTSEVDKGTTFILEF